MSYTIRAGDRTRTGDVQLGKLAFYQLNYARVPPTHPSPKTSKSEADPQPNDVAFRTTGPLASDSRRGDDVRLKGLRGETVQSLRLDTELVQRGEIQSSGLRFDLPHQQCELRRAEHRAT